MNGQVQRMIRQGFGAGIPDHADLIPARVRQQLEEWQALIRAARLEEMRALMRRAAKPEEGRAGDVAPSVRLARIKARIRLRRGDDVRTLDIEHRLHGALLDEMAALLERRETDYDLPLA